MMARGAGDGRGDRVATPSSSIDRRTLIKRAGAAGAAAWTAPLLIESLTSPAAALSPTGCPCATNFCISSNFNGTAVPANHFLWLNATTKINGPANSGPYELFFINQTFNLNLDDVGGTDVLIDLPDTHIIISSAYSSFSATYNSGTDTWEIHAPLSALGDDVFLGGQPYQLGAGGLPGGVSANTWCGDVLLAGGANRMSWQWSTAAYSQFSNDPNALGVNQDGVPTNFTAFVEGGARGGGGSNFTGSNSATRNCACPT